MHLPCHPRRPLNDARLRLGLRALVVVTAIALLGLTVAPAQASHPGAVDSKVAQSKPKPRLVGKPVAGEKLKCRTGSRAGAPSSLRYTWLRDDRRMAGQTRRAYRVRGRDTGKTLACGTKAQLSPGTWCTTGPA